MPERKLSLIYNPRYLPAHTRARRKTPKDNEFFTEMHAYRSKGVRVFDADTSIRMNRSVSPADSIWNSPKDVRNAQVANAVKSAMEKGHLPFVVNGSHVDLFTALGPVIKKHGKKIAVLVIDKHLDYSTLGDSTSAVHAQLIKPGNVLLMIKSVFGLPKSNFVVIHGQNLGPGIKALYEQLGHPRELKEIKKEEFTPHLHGLFKKWKKRGIEKVWVSFDVDYLRQKRQLPTGYAQAHHWKGRETRPSPEATAKDVTGALKLLKDSGFELLGISIEEYDPHRDKGGKGTISVKSVIKGVAGIAHRLWA